MQRRGRGLVALASLVVGFALPVVAAHAAPGDVAEQLDGTRDELSRAEADLTAIGRRLRELQDRIADADARLAVATGDLARVQADLAVAETALGEALERERAAAAVLSRADAELDERVDRWQETQRSVRRRAAEAYKYGGTTSTRLFLQGFTAPRDIHEVAVGARTLTRLAAAEDALLTRHVDEARAAAEARAKVASARQAAVAEQRVAEAQRRDVAALVEEQQQVVDAIADERAHRRAALAQLEADEDATAALVAQLGEQVRRLQAELLSSFVREAVDLPVDGPAPEWAAALPPGGRPWAAAIESAAARVGLDGRLFAALVWTESAFVPTAVSHANAIGLAQLLEGTAAGLGVDPYDPVQNLVGGARYLRIQMARFGRADLALAAYNAGPGRVERAGLAVPDIVETQLYVVRVLDRFERISRSG